jgi:hypothetical protein
MSRNRSPLRYLPAQAVDVASGPLVFFATVAALICLVYWRLAQKSPEAVGDPATVVQTAIGMLLTVAVLIAAGSVAGTDVASGFYRAWFSKPMAPWWFYLQRWLLGGVAVLTIPFLLGGGLHLLFGNGTGVTAELIGVVALGYLLIGGTLLLASVFTARDWLITFLLAFMQARLHDIVGMIKRTGGDPPRLLELADRGLPPYHLISPMRGLPEGGDLWHVIGYGTALVVLALVLFVVRPLGSGGRA